MGLCMKDGLIGVAGHRIVDNIIIDLLFLPWLMFG